jgi:hypothetical protein
MSSVVSRRQLMIEVMKASTGAQLQRWGKKYKQIICHESEVVNLKHLTFICCQ